MGFKPSQKIGIKLLDDVQLMSLLPQSKELLERIEQQRQRAANQDAHDSIGVEYYLMHDNIYGIFGGRGSGKTSILFSLRKKFIEVAKDNGDIVLPIVMPDLISNDCSLLGWVLAMLGDEVERINTTIRCEYSEKGMSKCNERCNVNFYENCRFNEHNSLQNEYESIYRECFGETRELSAQYSFGDVVSIRAEQSRQMYRLTRKLNHFWNRLISVKQAMVELKNPNLQNHQTPMIFIMFDDIDLAPERSIELLSASYRYFSNPNVAVFITAAFGTLERVLQYKMYEKVVGSNSNSLIQGMEWGNSEPEKYPMIEPYRMTQAKTSAVEYLNKIVPPSSRFFLISYVTCEQRKLFRYPGTQGELGYEPDSLPIEKFLKDQIEQLYLALNPQYMEDANSRLFLQNKDGEFLTAFLSIFGEKSRYISNGCFMLMNTLKELIRIAEMETPNEEYERQVYYSLEHLLSVLLSSNTREVAEYRSKVDKLLLFQRGQWEIYIDYGYLLELYRQERLKSEESIAQKMKELNQYMDRELFEEISQEQLKGSLLKVKRTIGIMFISLFFIENLVTLMFKRRGNIHGYRELADFLNRDTLDIMRVGDQRMKLFRNDTQVDILLEKYWQALDDPRPFLFFNPFDITQLEGYFDHLPVPDFDKLSSALNGDYDWCKTWLSLMFTHESGILYVNEDYQLRIRIFIKKLLLFSVGEYLEKYLYHNLSEFLQSYDIFTSAKLELKNRLDCMNGKYELPVQYDGVLKICKDLDLDNIFIDPIFSDKKLLDYYGCILWNRYRESKNSADSVPASLEEQYRDFIDFVEWLIDGCETALLANEFEVRIKATELEVVVNDLEILMPLSERVSFAGVRLYNTVKEHIAAGVQLDISEECTLPFKEFYHFIDVLNEALSTQIVDSLYTVAFTTEMSLMDSCPIYAEEGKEGQMADFILSLHTLHSLSGAYFSAQFLLNEGSQYQKGRKGRNTEQERGGITKLYHEILSKKDNPLYHLLSQARRDVVRNYANILEEKYG